MERIKPPGHNPKFNHPEIWCTSISDLGKSKDEIDKIAENWIKNEMANRFKGFIIQPSVVEEERFSKKSGEPVTMPGVANIQIPQVTHAHENYDPNKNTILIEDQTGDLEISLPDRIVLLQMNANRLLAGYPYLNKDSIALNSWKGDVGFYYSYTRKSGMRLSLTYLRENQILTKNNAPVLFDSALPQGI